MWKEIEKENYMQKVKDLKPVESFTDIDGIISYGFGYPCVYTIWGIGDTQILKCVMKKENRHNEWDYKYFEKL